MGHPAIHIRRASATDNELLAEIGRQAFFDSFAADNTPENMAAYLAASFGPDKQAAELADPAGTFFIAESGSTVVGFAHVHLGAPRGGIAAEHPLELARIYAVKDWIGRGIGHRLMQACLDEAARQSCDAVWLGVWERNTRAQAFYRRWGFVPVATQVFVLGDDPQTDLVMQRVLSAPATG